VKLTKILEEDKYEPTPQEKASRIEYFRDAIIFLTRINKKRRNPIINAVLIDMANELDLLTRK